VQLALGSSNTIGVKTDSKITFVGGGHGTEIYGLFKHVAASPGGFWCGSKADTDIYGCYGLVNEGMGVPGIVFEKISLGGHHGCGIDTTGNLVCWGKSTQGQTTSPSGIFVDVSAGDAHSCAVSKDDKLSCWGDDTYKQSTVPSGTFALVGAGRQHTCALRKDGTLACWGDPYGGRTDPPKGIFKHVSVMGDCSCAVTTAGEIACWGYQCTFPSPPKGPFETVYTYGNIGTGGRACAMRKDGEVICFDYKSPTTF